MQSIFDAITEWLKGLLVEGIMGNLGGLFTGVNEQVGEIAAQVGMTPAAWNAGVFSMIRQLSETVILPIAGLVLTFVMTYELIQMLMSATAYAQSNEPVAETEPPAAEETTTKPFTPDGTGTVVDNATDEDGKEFFTITTPSENIFYLVIDRQRTENNVYFLNAVTEKDLLALAEAAPEPEVTEPVVQPEPEPVPEPEPEPEKDTAFPVGNLLMVAAVALVGGGAAYYFKVYRPKHEAAGLDEDDYDYDEADPYGDMETEEETEDEE